MTVSLNGNGTTLRALVDLRDRTLQKSRVAFRLRVSAVERAADTMDESQKQLLERWETRFHDLEEEADGDIRAMVKDVTIVKKLAELKGIGLLLAGKLVSMIDIERASTVSALWRYAGYGVINGEREKPTKGEKLHYNIRLKTTCYLIATSFMRADSPYRKVYDDARTFYESAKPDWTKGHQHNAAIRKMIKVFLSHLWVEWRKLEGLDARAPYVIEKLNHEHEYLAKDFGWTVEKK